VGYFAYKARNASGELVQGVLEGSDSAAVASALFGSGVTPVEIDETSRPVQRGKAAAWALTKPRIKPIDLMLFSRQMYSLLKAGVPILRALAGLQESSVNPTFRETLMGVRESLESGRDLSASLQRQGSTFSPYYISMVYVGETTGRLEEVFLRLFHHIEFQEYMRTQVKSAVRYPMFVLIVMALVPAVAAPVEVHGFEMYTSVSVGIALSSAGYDCPDDMLRDAGDGARGYGSENYDVIVLTGSTPLLPDRFLDRVAREGLQPAGDVGGVAHRREGHAATAADVTGHHRPVVEAQAYL
jgi:hypothetical protein